MEVTVEHVVDAEEGRDEQACHAYRLYTFTEGHARLVVVRYDDEPAVVSFRFREERGRRRWRHRYFEGVPYDDPLLASAVRHLIEQEGVQHVRLLDATRERGTYAEVDLARLAR